MLDTDVMKSNLRNYYNQEAAHRNLDEKNEWKIIQRSLFYKLIKEEQKKTLLEIGAGTGQDSKFFMDSGLDVTAIDLSSEMIKICKEKSINAYEMDVYNVHKLDKSFDCIWSMNSLLHVPKLDLPQVLHNINSVLNTNGIFYMGVYGGEDIENNWINDITNIPRFFSFYSKDKLEQVLNCVFDIISFHQFDVGREFDFQSITMRKK